MGRPVNKRYFGITTTDQTDPTKDLSNDTNFTCNVKVGANSATTVGVILRQRTVNKFKVDDKADGTGNEGICTLVDKESGALGNNEMSIDATIAGGAGYVRIKKLYNRTCRDFNNTRYTWAIQDDSTTNIMVVTPI